MFKIIKETFGQWRRWPGIWKMYFYLFLYMLFTTPFPYLWWMLTFVLCCWYIVVDLDDRRGKYKDI